MVGVDRVPGLLPLNEQLSQLSARVEGNDIITSANRFPVDEDVGDCSSSRKLLEGILVLGCVVCEVRTKVCVCVCEHVSE